MKCRMLEIFLAPYCKNWNDKPPTFCRYFIEVKSVGTYNDYTKLGDFGSSITREKATPNVVPSAALVWKFAILK